MSERQKKEAMNLFADKKFAREAWKSIGQAILSRPATAPIVRYDKDGDVTSEYEIEKYTYETLGKDIEGLQQDRSFVTQMEMILACQAVKARWDTSAAVFMRDTTGGKPIDESKVDQLVTNVYESLSDEELEMLAQMRAHAKEDPCNSAPAEASGPHGTL